MLLSFLLDGVVVQITQQRNHCIFQTYDDPFF